ncbi:Calmodulin [Hexamita inflata]|uniref:Calmodulin n=1 Tax=Hexamita inflata TaxID=28002 RepID=A0AA86TQ60_9EUKA|nr:Calmodulin [Hexamita inflata]
MGCCSTDKVVVNSSQIDLRESNLDEIFKELDVDGDKQISALEIKKLMQSYSMDVSLKLIQLLIFCADKNGDGNIQRKELAKLFNLILHQDQMKVELAKLVDTNQEDDIQISEFNQMKQKLGWDDLPAPDRTVTNRSFENIVMEYINK